MKEVIKQFVVMAGGVWPTAERLHALRVKAGFPVIQSYALDALGTLYALVFQEDNSMLFDVSMFNSAAKELGYINGYRWGVEYPTNGKPDLPDDVVVCIEKNPMQDSVDGWDWPLIESFKITDQRYKPADISYLEPEYRFTPISVDADVDMEFITPDNWWDYENDKPLSFPPIGEKVEFNYKTEKQWEPVFVVAQHHYRGDLIIAPFETSGSLMYAANIDRFRPLDHATRKSEAEKKRVVDAAYKLSINTTKDTYELLNDLYDLGYLGEPQRKQK